MNAAGVHLFQLPLEAPPACVARLRRVLSVRELERAERFVFDRLRPPFIIAHAALRILLGRSLNRDPSRLHFEEGRYGKPFLAGRPVEFNLSHTGDRCLIAISERYPVGVDIERVELDRVEEGVLDIVTSPGERAAFQAMGAADRVMSFFRLWVRKEAVIKSFGAGLARRLDSISVPLGVHAPNDGVVLRPPPSPNTCCWLWDVEVPRSYVGAVVLLQPNGVEAVVPRGMQAVEVEALVM